MATEIISKLYRTRTVWLVLTAIACSLLAPSLAFSAAEEGEKLFQAKCASCHSIGSGDMAGPDLAGISEKRTEPWLRDVIQEPDELIGSGDPIMAELLEKYPMEMPALGLSDDQTDSLLLYMKAAQTSAAPGPQLPPGSSATGRSLFIGEARFSNGGPACISCHSAGGTGSDGIGLLGGGDLAKDLTNVYSVYKETGAVAALNSMQFPVMKDLYTNRALTEQEIADMTAYFKEIDQNQPQSRLSAMLIFAFLGIVVTFLLLILSQIVWGRRIRGVRKQLVGGSR